MTSSLVYFWNTRYIIQLEIVKTFRLFHVTLFYKVVRTLLVHFTEYIIMRKENSVEIELVFCNSFKSKSIKGVKWLTLDFERESSEVFGYLELGILGTGNKS